MEYRLLTFDNDKQSVNVGQSSSDLKKLREIANNILSHAKANGLSKYCEIVRVDMTFLLMRKRQNEL